MNDKLIIVKMLMDDSAPPQKKNIFMTPSVSESGRGVRERDVFEPRGYLGLFKFMGPDSKDLFSPLLADKSLSR